MSNDAQKLQDAMMAIHTCWGAPLYIIVILVLLYQEVEWSTFVGLGVMLCLVPITGMVAGERQTAARLFPFECERECHALGFDSWLQICRFAVMAGM